MSTEQISFGVFGPPNQPPTLPTDAFVAQVVKVQVKKIGTQQRVTLSLWDGARNIGNCYRP